MFDLLNILLILIVPFLVSLHVFVHFAHFGPVLSDGVLCLLDLSELGLDLFLRFRQLHVRLAQALILLVELLVQVSLILLVLIGQILHLQLQLLQLLGLRGIVSFYFTHAVLQLRELLGKLHH